MQHHHHLELFGLWIVLACVNRIAQEFFGTPNHSDSLKSIVGTTGRRTAVQIGGVLQYKLEVCCGISLRSQQGTSLQIGGVQRYKLEVYCQYFSDKLYGLGVPKQSPIALKTEATMQVADRLRTVYMPKWISDWPRHCWHFSCRAAQGSAETH